MAAGHVVLAARRAAVRGVVVGRVARTSIVRKRVDAIADVRWVAAMWTSMRCERLNCKCRNNNEG